MNIARNKRNWNKWLWILDQVVLKLAKQVNDLNQKDKLLILKLANPFISVEVG